MKYDKLARFTDRLEGESSKAHRARITYLLLGPQRSIARAAQTIREREPNNTDIRLFGEWSTNFKWTAQAEDYDSAVAYLAACQELDTYLADVEAYQERQRAVGRELHDTALIMLGELKKLAANLRYTPQTLLTIARTLEAAADLEGVALRVDEVMGHLKKQRDEDETA